MSEAARDRVEVVRGRIDEPLAERLVAFWTGQGALDEAAARQRLDDVVCVLRGADGEIAGVNSVYAADAPLIGRRLWMYRRFLPGPPDDGAEREMLSAAYDTLASEFTGAEGEPIGLCLLIGDRAAMDRHPEAVWPELDFFFAGYTDANQQVRARYFEGAMI